MKEDKTKRNTKLKIDSDNAARQFLTFRVGKEEYGIELMSIREIKGWAATTKLPNSPSFMKGVIDLRGIIIPIFDLKNRFHMGETNPTEKNVVIIAAIGSKLIGILVDAVSDILNVQQNKISSANNVESKIDQDFIDGLISVNEKMVKVLNVENIFDDETIKKTEKITTTAEA